MKVSFFDRELSALMAVWIGFLRDAKKVTYQSLALSQGIQRSNLSAFITSRGQTRNISLDKLRKILFDLGLLSDGTLAPGLHRWSVGENSVVELCNVLSRNSFESGYLFESGKGETVFLAVPVASNILVFVELNGDIVCQILDGLGREASKVKQFTLDRAGASEIKALWMTQDDLIFIKKFSSILEKYGFS